jgi:hypothetical protein
LAVTLLEKASAKNGPLHRPEAAARTTRKNKKNPDRATSRRATAQHPDPSCVDRCWVQFWQRFVSNKNIAKNGPAGRRRVRRKSENEQDNFFFFFFGNQPMPRQWRRKAALARKGWRCGDGNIRFERFD